LKGRIQVPQVCDIPGHDCVAILPGAQNHRSIDDIRRPPDTTKLTGCASGFVVERLDVNSGGGQESREPHLLTPVPPDLSDNSGRNAKSSSRLLRAHQQGEDAPVASLKGDQST
jgi:hypothetical protein